MATNEPQMTWERMCAAINEEFLREGEPNIDHLKKCMQAYTSNISDWGKYNIFDPQRQRYRSFGFSNVSDCEGMHLLCVRRAASYHVRNRVCSALILFYSAGILEIWLMKEMEDTT